MKRYRLVVSKLSTSFFLLEFDALIPRNSFHGPGTVRPFVWSFLLFCNYWQMPWLGICNTPPCGPSILPSNYHSPLSLFHLPLTWPLLFLPPGVAFFLVTLLLLWTEFRSYLLQEAFLHHPNLWEAFLLQIPKDLIDYAAHLTLNMHLVLLVIHLD